MSISSVRAKTAPRWTRKNLAYRKYRVTASTLIFSGNRMSFSNQQIWRTLQEGCARANQGNSDE